MIKAALYLRVSSDRQAKEGDSIPAQRDALRKYANEKAYIISGEYVDDGVSGTKADRDELTRLLDDVKSGKVDLILVTKLDRLYRSIKHYLNLMEILDKYNVGWTAIWEPIYDTTTPQGRLIVNQMMSIAQFEAENTGQRIRQVQAYKLTQKEVISGSTPPGYSIENKHLIPNADAANVLIAFETYARTGSLNETMRQVVGLSGIPKSKPNIKRMLKNTIYIGRHPSGIDDFCQPLIPAELFYDVQRLLSINIKKSQRSVYLFSGLIRCGECGHAYGANTRRRRRGSGSLEIIRQYRCSWHYNFKPPKCSNKKVIHETALEKFLIDNLDAIMDDTILKFETESKPNRDRASQISALQKKLSRLKELYINELITLEEYKADKEKYEKQITDLQSEQNRDPDAAAQAAETLRAIMQMDIKGIYEDLSTEERRRFWRGIISAIIIGSDRSIKVEFLALSSGTK